GRGFPFRGGEPGLLGLACAGAPAFAGRGVLRNLRWPEVELAVDGLALALPVALAAIAGVERQDPRFAVDLHLFVPDVPEAGHHHVDRAKEDDRPLDHLAAEAGLRVPLDHDPPAFGMGADVDVGIPLDDDLAAVHEVARVGTDVALHADPSALHPAPVAAIGRAGVVTGV